MSHDELGAEAAGLYHGLANGLDEERMKRLVYRLGKAEVGFRAGEALAAHCFLLFTIVQRIEVADRPAALAVIMRLVDPSQGHG